MDNEGDSLLRNPTVLERSGDRLTDAANRRLRIKKRGCLVIAVVDCVWEMLGVAEVIKTEDYRLRYSLSRSLGFAASCQESKCIDGRSGKDYRPPYSVGRSLPNLQLLDKFAALESAGTIPIFAKRTQNEAKP